MIYSNEKVRRQDRLLDEMSAIKLLKVSEYGVLSMYSDEEGIYAVPVNHVWDGKDSLYFHCATEGKKLNIIDLNNSVTYCIIGETNVISKKLTSEYESIILEGKIFRNLPEEERMRALEMMLDKYSPEDKKVGMIYAEKSFNRTEI
ncbi:MAG: pyridoxamine 5'-phosphate oxidase family protein [Ignavibacteria bacterium]